ncbi:MAG: thioesterase family protein [Bacteroidetes bacterium]|nr:thioesterase family protein [Bacteroidota bacterium]
MQYSHLIRVRYSECDPMGFVHHSVYAWYFEQARTEQMRSKGLSYKEMEDNGLIMPVRSMQIEFKKAGRYDDVLRIEVLIPEKPAVRCIFLFETYNQKDELLNTAKLELFYARKHDLRPVKIPDIILEKYGF